jgi:hypothetical protein
LLATALKKAVAIFYRDAIIKVSQKAKERRIYGE